MIAHPHRSRPKAASETGISAAKTAVYALQFAKLLLALMRNTHRSRSVHPRLPTLMLEFVRVAEKF